jgi:hypothetical protein
MSPVITARRTFQMLENESLWDAATRVNDALAARHVDYAVVGGVAVCLHGYRRNTVDLDVLIRPQDADAFRATMASAGFVWDGDAKEHRSASGVAVQVVMAGEPEGPGQEATFPNPKDASCVTVIEGLRVLSLAQLIQAKLACGLGDMRRTHKDFADVVELIAIHRLDGSFARQLHKSVRKEFRELVRRAR